MKRWMVLALMGVLVLTLNAFGFAAAPAKAKAAARPAAATFTVEGKVMEVSAGSFQLSVTKVLRGAGIKVGDKIQIKEAARFRVLQKGKRVALSALKADETVRVTGRILVKGKVSTYEGTTVTIL
ncbi:MAG: hypothetical protein QN198_08935 [Armatimonadota bacterium]|nr:hypothetical protein [Armatimonadota bacterium]MDR5703715.1 hypothetical protein [Armatimonadota bacterium]MDR7435244.1 hypothetical protein [Armatimonadota bacterium]